MTGAMPMLRCALHVHSTWSDGEFTLAELHAVHARAGVALVCLADHDYAFTPERLAAYVAECAALSDERVVLLPGLEYECDDRMHIVGYGAVAPSGTSEPAAVLRHIRACGGVSVIAHPRDAHFERIAALAEVPDGLEVWNTKYDGRQAPRARTFALLERLQQRNPGTRAFYGQDLHWRTQNRSLLTMVSAASRDRDVVLSALRAGAFHGMKDGTLLPSDGRLAPELLSRFDAANTRASRFYARLKRLKEMTGWFGRHLPAPIKAQLRRLF